MFMEKRFDPVQYIVLVKCSWPFSVPAKIPLIASATADMASAAPARGLSKSGSAVAHFSLKEGWQSRLDTNPAETKGSLFFQCLPYCRNHVRDIHISNFLVPSLVK